jgi:splicing factor 3B subunit 1
MEVDGDDDDDANGGRLIGQYTATAEQIGEWATGEAAEDDILNSREKQAQIQNRETDYQRKRFQRRLSAGGEGKSYKESMQERDLEREEERVNRARMKWISTRPSLP